MATRPYGTRMRSGQRRARVRSNCRGQIWALSQNDCTSVLLVSVSGDAITLFLQEFPPKYIQRASIPLHPDLGLRGTHLWWLEHAPPISCRIGVADYGRWCRAPLRDIAAGQKPWGSV